MIIALPATARDRSRIVPALANGSLVAASACDVDHVVTEFGVADLRDTDLEDRAKGLIAIAAPKHRDKLSEEWRALSKAR